MGTFLEDCEIARAVDVDAIVQRRQKPTRFRLESEERTPSPLAQNRRTVFVEGPL
jgi:hypothetical protein